MLQIQLLPVLKHSFVTAQYIAYIAKTYNDRISCMNVLLKPHSHCAGVATVHPDAGQPVYRDAPGHIS